MANMRRNAAKNDGLGNDDALQQAMNSQQAEIDELKGKLERLMAQCTQAQRENESLRGQVSSLQEANKSLQNSVDSICQTDDVSNVSVNNNKYFFVFYFSRKTSRALFGKYPSLRKKCSAFDLAGKKNIKNTLFEI